MSLDLKHRYHLPEGTVYGVLLNFVREREAWAERGVQAPYGGMPKAPVLYIKTANTFSTNGSPVALPTGVPALEIGATLGLIFDQDGLVERVAPFLDWSIPHEQFYRPAVRYKNRDGFLGVGSDTLTWQGPEMLAMLDIEVMVNQQLVQKVDWSGLYLGVNELVHALRQFTDFRGGDVLLLGLDCLTDGVRPLARAGDTVMLKTRGGLVMEQTVLGGSA